VRQPPQAHGFVVGAAGEQLRRALRCSCSRSKTSASRTVPRSPKPRLFTQPL
jgi:hypothetical protein